MTAIRDLTPGDARELTTLYEEYEWWADREMVRMTYEQHG